MRKKNHSNNYSDVNLPKLVKPCNIQLGGTVFSVSVTVLYKNFNKKKKAYKKTL